MLFVSCGTCCLVAGALIVATALQLPLAQSDSSLAVAKPFVNTVESTAPAKKLAETDFQWVWAKRLQGPLVDPKPVEETKVVQESKPKAKPIRLKAKLIATLVDVDPTNSIAWIEVNGKRKAYTQGAEISSNTSPATVSSIDDESVELDVSGQPLTITIERGPAFDAPEPGVN